ncbi:MAG TPA: hypothetical protein VGD53_24240 [Actinoallomurus sp.]
MTGAAGAAAIAGIGGIDVGAAEAATAREAPGRGRTVRLREGTDLAAQLSPDGRHIAIDIVGVLWVLPASGGPARRLTSDLYDIAQPEWSPDSRWLTFQSYREGVFDIWVIRPDGSGLRRLTHGPYDHREPRFSPDGKRIAFSSDLTGSYGIHTLDVGTGAITQVTDTAVEEYEPAWSPDGKRIAFVVASTRIDVVDVATGARTTPVRTPGPRCRSPV